MLEFRLEMVDKIMDNGDVQKICHKEILGALDQADLAQIWQPKQQQHLQPLPYFTV